MKHFFILLAIITCCANTSLFAMKKGQEIHQRKKASNDIDTILQNAGPKPQVMVVHNNIGALVKNSGNRNSNFNHNPVKVKSMNRNEQSQTQSTKIEQESNAAATAAIAAVGCVAVAGTACVVYESCCKEK